MGHFIGGKLRKLCRVDYFVVVLSGGLGLAWVLRFYVGFMTDVILEVVCGNLCQVSTVIEVGSVVF